MQGTQQAQQQQQQAQPSGDGESMPPGLDGVELRDAGLADAAAWGALPARLRDTLRQGLSERFSSLYERFTEAYYRRLAEEGEQ